MSLRQPVVFLTNAPAPYRERVHELVHEALPDYCVLYCQDREPNRLWSLTYGGYPRQFLRERSIAFRGRYIHFNLDVFSALDRIDPLVVISGGFNPTFLLAFLWCLVRKRQHVCFTDGWLGSESGLSPVHRAVRRLIYGRSSAFIGAGKHSLDLYRAYGLPDRALFQSPLCANNERFGSFKGAEKTHDLVFSGQFIERKCPEFFVSVAAEVRSRRGKCSALLLGDGPLKGAVLRELSARGVDVEDAGFVQQEDLPAHYARGRIFLFPTLCDPWGVVANEACAAGLPVLTCPAAGVAGDLVIHDVNGYVLPLEKETWVDHIVALLDDADRYQRMAEASLEQVKRFTYPAAKEGITSAVAFALSQDARFPSINF